MTRPAGQPQRVVVLLSDGPWDAADADLAARLAAQGTLVLGVDSDRYWGLVPPRDCTFAAADFEALSQAMQKDLGLPDYRPPILVGVGAGAVLAYAALAQSPPDTFHGGVGVDFCPVLPPEKALCHGTALAMDKKPAQGGPPLLRPSPELENPWLVLEPVAPRACTGTDVGRFVQGLPGAELTRNVPAAGAPLADAVLAALGRIEARRPPQRRDTPVADLPLFEVPASGAEQDALAVVLSGDGGWTSLDRRMGRQFAAQGVPAIGVDSLRYFWHPKEPDGAAADLARILAYYLKAWRKSSALLVGYSQGADVLPFMAGRMPADLKARVKLVGIVGSDGAARFDRALSSGVTGREPAPDRPVQPEIARLAGMNPVCVYGTKEHESICHRLSEAEAQPLVLDSDHAFKGDAGVLVRAFLRVAGLRQGDGAPAAGHGRAQSGRHGQPAAEPAAAGGTLGHL